ncbi:MAG: TerC family protein [Candidatus Omnitrophica bacterium]|nr:TerC family protein [Candidatus Omnitrophota bacterium]
MLETFLVFDNLVALLTLTLLEIVLGIDNIIFISILTGKLPADQQARGRNVGLAFAMLTRIALLFSITWVMGLTKPLLTLWHHEVSGRDLILIFGGMFLLAKSTHEIHNKLEGEEHDTKASGGPKASFVSVIIQIMILDIVFSLDSVITAVGMSNHVEIMVLAVMIAVGFMMVFSGAISHFVHKHPTIKMLALAFLLLIGVTLIAEGFHNHISKGYIYFAMAFSVFVEMLNLRMKKPSAAQPIELREPTL